MVTPEHNLTRSLLASDKTLSKWKNMRGNCLKINRVKTPYKVICFRTLSNIWKLTSRSRNLLRKLRLIWTKNIGGKKSKVKLWKMSTFLPCMLSSETTIRMKTMFMVKTVAHRTTKKIKKTLHTLVTEVLKNSKTPKLSSLEVNLKIKVEWQPR